MTPGEELIIQQFAEARRVKILEFIRDSNKPPGRRLIVRQFPKVPWEQVRMDIRALTLAGKIVHKEIGNTGVWGYHLVEEDK